MQPSKGLKQIYQKECQVKCKEYKYWWSCRPKYLAHHCYQFDKCVFDCVQSTVEKERPESGYRPHHIVKNMTYKRDSNKYK